MDDTASRFAPQVQLLMAFLAEFLGLSFDNLLVKLFNKKFVKCLDKANDAVQQQSAWPSKPGELSQWIERHLLCESSGPQDETKFQLANEIKALMTTLGSLLIARQGLKDGKLDKQILHEIHDFWVVSTKECLKDFPDKLLEREEKGQFLPYEELTESDQFKDQWFLNAIRKIKETSQFWFS